MKEASDGDASQRRQELPREYFTFWQHGFENEKKLFFCKNEKNNFFVYFLYFLFHFHRIPMTCCQHVLIAAETKFCHENEKPKLFISCRFFLNLSSLCDLIFLSLLIATLQMISLSDGDWKGMEEEEYRPFLIVSPMPGENKLTKILS